MGHFIEFDTIYYIKFSFLYGIGGLSVPLVGLSRKNEVHYEC